MNEKDRSKILNRSLVCRDYRKGRFGLRCRYQQPSMAFFFAVLILTSSPTFNLAAVVPQSRVTTLSLISVTVHLPLAARATPDVRVNIAIVASSTVVFFSMIFSSVQVELQSRTTSTVIPSLAVPIELDTKRKNPTWGHTRCNATRCHIVMHVLSVGYDGLRNSRFWRKKRFARTTEARIICPETLFSQLLTLGL